MSPLRWPEFVACYFEQEQNRVDQHKFRVADCQGCVRPGHLPISAVTADGHSREGLHA